MDRDGRALFSALQHKEGIDVIRPLVTPERAALKDPYYRLKPLFWALSYGASPEVVKTLLSAHPEAANEKHPTEGWTPLHYVERLDPETVQLLLERCPKAAKEQDAGGELPLHWAAEHGALEAARLLLQAYPDGAQVEDHLGRLPVRMAADGEVGEDLLEVLREATPGAAAALPAAPIQEPLPIGLLFPGQGSQYVRMLESAQGIPAVQAMLVEAQDILGYDLLKVCLEGPAEKLADTLYCQPVMYVAGLAALEQLRLEKPDVAARPKSMAGLSLGEYTALTAAGAAAPHSAPPLVPHSAFLVPVPSPPPPPDPSLLLSSSFLSSHHLRPSSSTPFSCPCSPPLSCPPSPVPMDDAMHKTLSQSFADIPWIGMINSLKSTCKAHHLRYRESLTSQIRGSSSLQHGLTKFKAPESGYHFPC